MKKQIPVSRDPEELRFLKESRWLAFKSATWGAVGMATFFGALTTITLGLVSIATGLPATVAGGIPTASAALLGGALPLSVLGGLMAFGVLATYMSQSEASELRILQDNHMAQQQAKCMLQDRSPTLAFDPAEHSRADGKKWSEVVANENQPLQAVKR